MIQAGLNLTLQAQVSGLDTQETANEIGEVSGQDTPQPLNQFPFADAAKAAEGAMRLQERFLDEVGGVHLALKSLPDLRTREEFQVAPIQLQQVTEGLGTALTSLPQESQGSLFQTRFARFRHPLPRSVRDWRGASADGFVTSSSPGRMPRHPQRGQSAECPTWCWQ